MDDSKRTGGEAAARAPQQQKIDTSRVPGFYNLPVEQRVNALARLAGLTAEERELLLSESASLPLETANQMIENAVGVLSLPLGVGLNFRVNGRDVLVPMAVEEP